ncbi:MAG: acyl-CoA thioesterase [Acinetobacter sp.]|nr:acyl-CoA thioesterase [Acinetobacter sp.]
MYPFLRWGKTIVQSVYQNYRGHSLNLYDTSEIEMYANPSDIDNFLEMNNGRIFTLFDLGRMDFAIRTGLGKQLLKQKWGLVVAGSSIQYRKRVRMLDKVKIKTRLLGIDERWIYIEQTMWVKGQATSHALLRTGITNIKTGKVIATADVFQAMGVSDFDLTLPDWVESWADADKLRPFPQGE